MNAVTVRGGTAIADWTATTSSGLRPAEACSASMGAGGLQHSRKRAGPRSRFGTCRGGQSRGSVGAVGHATYGHTAIARWIDPKRHRRAVIFTDHQQHDSGQVSLEHVPLHLQPGRLPPISTSRRRARPLHAGRLRGRHLQRDGRAGGRTRRRLAVLTNRASGAGCSLGPVLAAVGSPRTCD